MALTPRDRQKKKERKKSKKRARQRALAKDPSRTILARMRHASAAPVLDCKVSRNFRESGMATVLISRRLASGSVAYAIFLVDRFAHGVKGVVYDIVPADLYRFAYNHLYSHIGLAVIEPECARKLVEESVEFARAWGTDPPVEYATAREIFGDIDAGLCSEVFEFGSDGKPLLVLSPDVDPAQSEWILQVFQSGAADELADR